MLLGRTKKYDEALKMLDELAQSREGKLGPNELSEKGRLLDQMGHYDDAFRRFRGKQAAEPRDERQPLSR